MSLLNYIWNIKDEIKEVVIIGLSMAVSQSCLALINMLVLYYSGMLSVSDLDGVGLAVALFNMTGYAASNGVGAACETLFSQAYGSTDKKKVAVFLQRSIIFFSLMLVIMISVNINCDLVLELLGQDPVLSCIARRFLMVTTPGYIGLFTSRMLMVYLRVQDIYWPIIISSVLAVIISAICGYVSVSVFNFGVDALALSFSSSHITLAIGLIVYTYYSKVYIKTWTAPSKLILYGWAQFVKLVIAGFLLIFGEYSFVEVMIILTGQMGKIQLGAQVIVNNIYLVLQNIIYGFSIGACVRVGTSLGAGDVRQAIRSMRLNLGVGLFVAVICVTVTTSLRQSIISLYTEDWAIIELGEELMIWAGIVVLIESVYNILNGVMRGAGRQALASYVIIINFSLFGLPALLLVAYLTPLQGLGLWYVMTGVVTATSCAFVLITQFCIDWNKEAVLASKRHNTNNDADENESEILPILGENIEEIETEIVETSSSSHSIETKKLLQKRLLQVIVVIGICACTSVLNMTGVIKPVRILGARESFINHTSVKSCQHLIGRNLTSIRTII